LIAAGGFGITRASIWPNGKAFATECSHCEIDYG
jgi:hypothetical protein